MKLRADGCGNGYDLLTGWVNERNLNAGNREGIRSDLQVSECQLMRGER